jgi:hypothetical protein
MGGWLHRTTARSAVGAARPSSQPIPSSAIEPALRELGYRLKSESYGKGDAKTNRFRDLLNICAWMGESTETDNPHLQTEGTALGAPVSKI